MNVLNILLENQKANVISAKLRQDIINTQESRRALHLEMESGTGEHWDYMPRNGVSQQYVRNHMDWTLAADRYRFPPLIKITHKMQF